MHIYHSRYQHGRRTRWGFYHRVRNWWTSLAALHPLHRDSHHGRTSPTALRTSSRKRTLAPDRVEPHPNWIQPSRVLARDFSFHRTLDVTEPAVRFVPCKYWNLNGGTGQERATAIRAGTDSDSRFDYREIPSQSGKWNLSALALNLASNGNTSRSNFEINYSYYST